ncbi:DUF2332 domain-containing protein [Virgibacillus sp. MG-45]|uniref:DUF2332 domain-containing protein n=1 Tax=Virgibacillus sp. MG-45 TaxID=3102791 RepID=UPI002ED83D0D
MDYQALSNRFMRFAEECSGSSTLYAFLSKNIAANKELLELSAHAGKGQPIPNLFFGAVHFLLLNGTEHELRNYYASIVSEPKTETEAFPVFFDFCLRNRQAIIPLLQTKMVQTNEVRRCAYLLPIFDSIYRKTNKPLAFIEIGTSAGLQLLWDKYRYTYSFNNQVYGNEQESLYIHAEVRGNGKPIISERFPPVERRIGIDLHINDVTDKASYQWMYALIWPEHHERRAMFKQAVSLVRKHKEKLQLIEGNAIDMLVELVEEIPMNNTVCIFHTHVANQIPKQEKERLLSDIAQIGESRDIFHIYNNMWDRKLHLDAFMNKEVESRVVGETDGHGRWFTWELEEW